MRTRLDVRISGNMYDLIHLYKNEKGLTTAQAVRELLADSLSELYNTRKDLLIGGKKYDSRG